jgi:uncharacterized tellurite resistance protein B-like protein
MLESLLARLKCILDNIAPSEEERAQREALTLQRACCSLLMEVARIAPTGIVQKRSAVASAMREEFPVSEAALSEMMARVARAESRLTSYYEPVKVINQRWEPGRKSRLVERLWRVAIADGEIDAYEDQLVRKLADLMYVGHADFILARRRVEGAGSR